jgi:predicted membrane protein
MMDFDKDSFKDSIGRDTHDRIGDQMRGEIRKRYGNSAGAYNGLIWGGAICVVGTILLLDHLGLVAAGNIWRFWPMLLIVVGAMHVTQPGKRPWGSFLILVGVLFQLDNLGVIHFQWAELWPVAIIAAGAMMIWNSVSSRRYAATMPVGQATLDANAVFGGIERRITARDFKYGTINAVFGGVELDFHDADIDGDEAVIEINAVFGGVEIRVPDNWQVEARNQTVFGGFTDSTRGSSAAVDPSAPKRKRLIITGSAVFGGIEFKN